MGFKRLKKDKLQKGTLKAKMQNVEGKKTRRAKKLEKLRNMTFTQGSLHEPISSKLILTLYFGDICEPPEH